MDVKMLIYSHFALKTSCRAPIKFPQNCSFLSPNVTEYRAYGKAGIWNPELEPETETETEMEPEPEPRPEPKK